MTIKITVMMLLGFVFQTTSLNAQKLQFTQYKVGPVPYILDFNKMNEDEIRLDTMLYNSNKQGLESMLDGSGFIEGVSDEDKKSAIENHKASSLRYRDNRSRYYLQNFRNGVQSKEGALTSFCDCSLIGDTIKVSMGLIFGNIITMDINKSNFNSNYNEGGHEQMVYRKSLLDTNFYDQIKVRNSKQILVLQKKPTFRVGDKLLGFLEFKSKEFYKMEGWESGLNYDTRLNKLFVQGVLNFKCEVRKNIYGR